MQTKRGAIISRLFSFCGFLRVQPIRLSPPALAGQRGQALDIFNPAQLKLSRSGVHFFIFFTRRSTSQVLLCAVLTTELVPEGTSFASGPGSLNSSFHPAIHFLQTIQSDFFDEASGLSVGPPGGEAASFFADVMPTTCRRPAELHFFFRLTINARFSRKRDHLF